MPCCSRAIKSASFALAYVSIELIVSHDLTGAIVALDLATASCCSVAFVSPRHCN
ncbi:MAG: hypothetical protein NVS2B12_26100 [Ktedonobacteraceae bacterium]